MHARPSGGPPPGAIRLVATDLDGTLLDPSGEVSPRAARAVRAARQAGIHVVPVTGRPPQALWRVGREAGLGPLGVCSNGAVLVDVAAEAVIEVERIAGEIAGRLCERARVAVPGIRLAVDEVSMFTYERGFFDNAVDWQEALCETLDAGEVAAAGCIKLLARLPGLHAVGLRDRLARELGPAAELTASGPDWVEIGPPGVSKAYALARVCDRLGISIDEVAAIGDHHNDLTVLAWAGTALAPENAIPEVLAVVGRVLPSNADDGVAEYLEELAATAPAGRARP